MKRNWTKWLAVMLAGSMLMGCGSQPGNPDGAKLMTADGGTTDGGITGGEATGSGAAGSGTTGGGAAGSEATGGRSEQPDGPGANGEAYSPAWNYEDDGSYEALRRFSHGLMLENMEEENPLLSPVSAYFALGMAAMGARGETLQEFQEIMGDNMPAVSRKLMEFYPREQEGMVLNIANSAWVDQELTPNGQWVQEIEEIFRGEGYQGILSSQATMEQINAWCSENTRELVPKMLEDPLDETARLALLDAIYFKGDWEIPFDALNTVKQPFTTEDGTRLQVDTMCMTEKNQRYLHSSLGEGVLLPYQGGDFAYVAILPEEGTPVRQLYSSLTPEALAELLESENTELCNLRLPKYEVSFDRKLNESLQAMGLVRAFEEKLADFSGLGTTGQGNPMYISLVRQKAVFRVDEKGTEAAAVTMVAIAERAALLEPRPRELYFDRPFVYMILHQESQIPLFVGIMDNPG
ncbi:MAG: serpin family protein [Lachnospiraceae bacterium]|nr:serpin family protein [Lachnospiraceae bacterium]